MGPNFFIAGAPKAGTTSLYHNLRQHPQVYMSPVKEPAYFAAEARVENFTPTLQPKMRSAMERLQFCIRQGRVADNQVRGIVADEADYLQLFSGVREERAIGEASVCYLWSQTAPAAIARTVPQAKIILILRHPAERAFSQYLHYLSDGHVAHSFKRHIQLGLQPGDGIGYTHPFLEYGLYASQVERYLACFPHTQVRIWLYEETVTRPSVFLREVFEFLEVDAAFVPDSTRRYHRMQIPRSPGAIQWLRRTPALQFVKKNCPSALRPLWKRTMYLPRKSVKIGPEERCFLINHYREDIHNLQRILDRDLSTWMV